MKFFKCVLVLIGLVLFISSMNLSGKYIHKVEKLRTEINDDDLLANAEYYLIKENVPIALSLSTSKNESNLKKYAVHVNRDGTIDRGYFQLNSKSFKLKDYFNTNDNVKNGIGYIAWCIQNSGNSIENGLMSYNAGIGNFYRGNIPNSTKQYVKNILIQKEKYEKIMNA